MRKILQSDPSRNSRIWIEKLSNSSKRSGSRISVTDDGGLTNIDGYQVKLDGDSLVLSSSGLKINDDLSYLVNTWTESRELVLGELNQIHIFNSALDLECTLPSVTSSDIGKWVIIVKAGTGDLTINANGTNTILDSDPGGRIECTNNDYDYQKMGLRLFMTTAWHSGPECFGIWSTR